MSFSFPILVVSFPFLTSAFLSFPTSPFHPGPFCSTSNSIDLFTPLRGRSRPHRVKGKHTHIHRHRHPSMHTDRLKTQCSSWLPFQVQLVRHPTCAHNREFTITSSSDTTDYNTFIARNLDLPLGLSCGPLRHLADLASTSVGTWR